VLILLVFWYLFIALIFYGGSRVALPVAPAFVIFASYMVMSWLSRRYSLSSPVQAWP
jgi:Zn-dependent protease with chaperone function